MRMILEAGGVVPVGFASQQTVESILRNNKAPAPAWRGGFAEDP